MKSTAQLTLRAPLHLIPLIDAAAARRGVSRNAEIVRRLTAHSDYDLAASLGFTLTNAGPQAIAQVLEQAAAVLRAQHPTDAADADGRG